MEQSFDIDKLAKLSMLDLTDEERAEFSKQLPAIVEYVARLAEVDTSKVSAKAYLTDLTNVFRSDEPKPSTPAVRQAVIDNFPKKTGEALEVPGVFE